MDVAELVKSYEATKDTSHTKVILVINNLGEPTAVRLTRENSEVVKKFYVC